MNRSKRFVIGSHDASPRLTVTLQAGFAIFCLVAALPTPPCLAEYRDHPSVRRAFQEVVRPARESTVIVLRDRRHVALGAIVSEDGLVITKASELDGKSFTCKTSAGEQYKARVVATDGDLDLAMLRLTIDDQKLKPVEWRSAKPLPLGSLLATASTDRLPVAIGVVSVEARNIRKRPGFLGVGLTPSSEGPLVNLILEKSAAAEAGVKIGDVVRKINGRRIESRQAMVELISGMRPGDRVRLDVLREDEQKTIKAKLGSRDVNSNGADRFAEMNAMGGPLSRRRSGFATAIQHDTILEPHHCGGPIVDLDGKVVGINIARAARTHSYALTADVVKKAVAELVQQATAAD